jgi:hypothetical protein
MSGVSVIGAIYYRKRSDWHKRFMLCATLALLGAPILRILLSPNIEFSTAMILGFVFLDLLFLRCFAYDILTRGRIHPAFTYALALFIVSEITMANLPSWGPWLHLSQSVQHLLS